MVLIYDRGKRQPRGVSTETRMVTAVSVIEEWLRKYNGRCATEPRLRRDRADYEERRAEEA